MNAAIHIENVGLSVGAFEMEDANMIIPSGKITAIVGPNGSGKSTMLKVITKLLTPDKGEVFINQKPLKTYKSKDFAKDIAMLTQSKEMIPDLTVRELVSFGRSPHKPMFKNKMTHEDNDIIDWALKITGTKRYQHQMFYTLSGGEQQKARIAMALAQKTNILLLDEPTTYLDIAHQFDVMEMLQQINRDHQITIVMVLHDLQQAAAYCDHMIAMKRGLIAMTGEPQTVLTSEFLKDVYNMDARIKFDEGYPLIIPNPRKNQEDTKMIIVTNASHITKGNAHKLIERFDRVGDVEKAEGFLGLEVLLTEKTKDYEEVSIVTRWNTKDDFQAWTRSDAFREAHSRRGGTPDYIISNTITFYEVKVIRNPIAAAN
ncbi:heme oxygenase [Paenibacillus sp. Leaf72]|uniref:heme oxygenase n=1 Tax=Paenibacillus sp. Leaf72 TaxID=1736234 RepID=UPI0006FC55A9|nr:heme oxygenase [Paenibacillus sp. Leaf72]KQO09594.1 iron ABC transporter ATP-binding protein [Paenibacillus sp. Leaf72]